MAAIYQQARPVTFEQVIGQEHIKSVLQAALHKERIGHAYLFSGPRGVGKTTTARLLAMAVNCERETRPCGGCVSCRLVRSGSHPDVIELDAASNNSVDDVRDLREKVNLAAIRGGMRVWILDEAHMLTKSASNALLKTLEEPPPNLMFVLATTEPEKLPPTVLSRCQHYRFRRLADDEIMGKLTMLCEQAGVEAETEALALVARAADGAMRDGESLLERLLTSGERITRAGAEDALGLPPQERLASLAQHLATGDLNKLLQEAATLYQDGFAPRTLAERLTMTLRDALYAHVGVAGHTSFKLPLDEAALLRVIHALDDEAERFVRHDDLFSLEVALVKALNTLRHNVPSDAAIAAPAQTPTLQAPREAQPHPAPQTSGDTDFFDRAPAKRPARQSTPRPSQERTPQPQPPKASPKPRNHRDVWNTMKRQAKPQLKAFMMPGEAASLEGQELRVVFPDTHKFHFEKIKRSEQELGELFMQVIGEGYTLLLEGPATPLRIGQKAASVTVEIAPPPPITPPSATSPVTPPPELSPSTPEPQTPPVEHTTSPPISTETKERPPTTPNTTNPAPTPQPVAPPQKKSPPDASPPPQPAPQKVTTPEDESKPPFTIPDDVITSVGEPLASDFWSEPVGGEGITSPSELDERVFDEQEGDAWLEPLSPNPTPTDDAALSQTVKTPEELARLNTIRTYFPGQFRFFSRAKEEDQETSQSSETDALYDALGDDNDKDDNDDSNGST